MACGNINLAQTKLDSAIAQLEPVFASLKPRLRDGLAPVSEDDELASLSLTGFAVSALNELMEDIQSDPKSVSATREPTFPFDRKDAS